MNAKNNPDDNKNIPSQTDCAQERVETPPSIKESELIMQDLELLFKISDAELRNQQIKSYIARRYEVLHNVVGTDSSQLSSFFIQTARSKFITENIEIIRSMMVDPFIIDDIEIYQPLLQRLQELSVSWNCSIQKISLHAVIYALGDYFGNYYTTTSTEARNRKFYLDHTSADHVIHISEMKGMNFAVCAEKTSVAHNYLKFLGIDSHLVFSNNCIIGEGNSAHAYICFKTRENTFIFDPTNPKLIQRPDNTIYTILPGIYKIADSEFQALIKKDGTQVSVEHFDEHCDENGSPLPTDQVKPRIPDIRIYG